MGLRDRGIEYKSAEQIAAMRRAGLVVGGDLEKLRAAVRPGITTEELDAVAEDHIRSVGRDAVVPGLPRLPGLDLRVGQRRGRARHPRDRVLTEGDVVSLDCGAIVDGWHGDAAITVAVGEVPAEVAELMRVTEESLWRGIAAARLGGRVTDISHAVETHVRAAGAVRDPRGLRRPRHRLGDAPAAQRAQLRRCRPGPQAGAGPGAGRRADGDAGQPRGRRARRRLDRRDHRRLAGRPTSSTPSPSRPTAPGCSPPSTAVRRNWPRSGCPMAGQ